jgi:limonene-1,2-epoxide hydrolase
VRRDRAPVPFSSIYREYSIVSDHIRIVEDFIAAWGGKDVAEIMKFISGDCVYHNIPLEPINGSDEIEKFVTGFVARPAEVVWEIHQIAETAGGVVLTERTDRFRFGERWVAMPVMGSFEIEDGKISAWRDYFDYAQYKSQLD